MYRIGYIDDQPTQYENYRKRLKHNSIDITTFDGYILRIDCNKAEKGLKNTAWTDHVLNALAIDNLLETCNPSDTDGFVLSQQRNTDIYRCRG